MTAQPMESGPVLGDPNYSTIPAGLTAPERLAYNRGFSRAVTTFIRKNGGPGIVHDGTAPAAGTAAHRMLSRQLAESGRAHRAARHDSAHRGGMSALRTYLRKTDQLARLTEIVDTYGKPARKPVARKLASVPTVEPVTVKPVEPVEPVDVVAAAVESGRVIVTTVGRDGKARQSRKLSPADLVSTPVEPVEPVAGDRVDYSPAARAARKLARRELAARLRAAGIVPNGEAWEAAKRVEGIS